MKTTIRLVNRGEEHPYVIEVMTPGWRGVDAAFEGAIKLPEDLKQIMDILKQAKVKLWKTLFVNDGATEFVLEDATDLQTAADALVLAGWLPPGTAVRWRRSIRTWRRSK
jgi:hypothetical protein